ncbi:hypothetical protein UFOVP1254_35 [uncultured Caudovirales phage]|uniref:Uncharacterized protein n=1 Tax=uncultured Caudovirales phage TaxID=2100421 RepID=A0A6J5RKW3_9CAUD|nr:hypothetical protein UFOVP1254_35 [uncultured Caudovirales phage]
MFNHHEYEAPGERLLLVQMEGRPSYACDHRHIIAHVVRRACANKPCADDPTRTQTYYDGKNPVGYRSANWHVGCDRKNALYVQDLEIRGQIDAYMPDHKKLADGAPYAGAIRFRPYEVEHQNAIAMANFFRRYDAFRDKILLAGNLPQQDNEFFRSCLLIWTFLDLKKMLIRIPTSGNQSIPLSNSLGFVEHNWADGLKYIQGAYLDEFAVKPVPAEARNGD